MIPEPFPKVPCCLLPAVVVELIHPKYLFLCNNGKLKRASQKLLIPFFLKILLILLSSFFFLKKTYLYVIKNTGMFEVTAD